jgi:hypothetical protein
MNANNDASRDFAALLARMTQAICRGEGLAAAACFIPNGTYHDGFYGAFHGRAAIAEMVEHYFHRDASAFEWQLSDALSDGRIGYARYDFSYVPKLDGSVATRAGFHGISMCRLRDGLIEHYGEQFDRGTALARLGFADARIVKTLRRWATER